MLAVFITFFFLLLLHLEKFFQSCFRGNDFRPCYRRLGELRSFLRKDVVFIALTATATNRIRDDICRVLLLSKPSTVHVPIERTNIYYEVVRFKSGDFSFFDHSISLLRNDRDLAPKMIIYCRNVKTVASLFNYFSLSLGKDQFLGQIGVADKRLFAMFHRSSTEETKTRVLEEFKKPDSVIRTLIATSSFEMGLDFPDVLYVVNLCLPRSIESFAQQSGRGGRNIPQAFSIIMYDGVAGKGATTDAMRRFVVSEKVCRREILMQHFSLNLNESSDQTFPQTNKSPVGCHCCDVCRKACKCGCCLPQPWKSSTVPMLGGRCGCCNVRVRKR